MMTWNQVGFQDPASPIMEELIMFHDYTMMILVFIITNVLLMLIFMMVNKLISLYSNQNQWLESVWTIVPGLVLIQLAVPSLTLLYLLEEDSEYGITVKAMGHQWYWAYELASFNNEIEYDSYMLSNSSFRLLDVDNRLVLPLAIPVRILVSSSDVLHAWTVPSLGVKADACPGRINQMQFTTLRPGVYCGQCSEICGANHSFMPIVIEVVSLKTFMNWAM